MCFKFFAGFEKLCCMFHKSLIKTYNSLYLKVFFFLFNEDLKFFKIHL